jgi:hypothetical protein
MGGPCCLLLGAPYSYADIVEKPGDGRETLATQLLHDCDAVRRIYMGTHDMRIRLE